jgi:hypothetical protein
MMVAACNTLRLDLERLISTPTQVRRMARKVVNIGSKCLRAAIRWKSSVMASIRAGTFGYWDKVSVPAKWASRLEKSQPVLSPCETPVVKGTNATARAVWWQASLISCHKEPHRASRGRSLRKHGCVGLGSPIRMFVGG